MNKSIEILMAVYNQEKYLSEQLDSIFKQTHSHFHLIIRDNCSTDRTKEILKKWSKQYPEKISVIYGEKNLGVIGNFSALAEMASASYVMFSDSDDVWLPHKIEKSYHAMQEMEDKHGNNVPLLVHTDLAVTDGNLHICLPSFWNATNLDGGRPLELKRALVENQVTGCTIMMNNALLQLARPFPSQVAMHDAWIALVASGFGHVKPLAESTILYRQHGNNDTGASSYGIKSHLKKLLDKKKRNKIIETRNKRIQQAEIFLEKFESRLSENKRNEVKTYLKANQSFLPIRAYLLWKNNLLESGMLRKLFQVFVR
jgi:glycosyltransferase involved in cell wall biosynthesis